MTAALFPERGIANQYWRGIVRLVKQMLFPLVRHKAKGFLFRAGQREQRSRGGISIPRGHIPSALSPAKAPPEPYCSIRRFCDRNIFSRKRTTRSDRGSGVRFSSTADIQNFISLTP
jgi:hypothetical protein